MQIQYCEEASQSVEVSEDILTAMKLQICRFKASSPILPGPHAATPGVPHIPHILRAHSAVASPSLTRPGGRLEAVLDRRGQAAGVTHAAVAALRRSRRPRVGRQRDAAGVAG